MAIDYTKIFETSLNEIYIFSADTLCFIEVNQGARDNVGYTMQELHKLTPLDLKPAYNKASFEALLAPLRTGEKAKLIFETYHRRKNGTHYPVEVHLQTNDLEGESVFVAFILDITERKKAEEAAAYGKAIIDSSSDAIISKTLDGIIVSWNQGAENIYGYTAEEIIGKSIATLIPPDHLNDLSEILDRIRSGERVQHFEAVRARKDGTLIDVSLTISPIRDALDNITGASVIARDITQTKQTRQKMIELAIQRERTQIVQEFIRDSSHEFRNRLAIIGTKCELISREPLSERQGEHVDVIYEQVHQLDKLIGNLHELTVLQNTYHIKQQPTPVNTLIHNLVERVKIPETRTVQLHLEHDLPEILAESPLLNNALYRLLKNAVDFTDVSSEIFIETACRNNHVTITIQDTGDGIHADDLPHIFDPFYRSDKARTLNGQFGIGLSIAQRIIHLHGGEIQVDSTNGEGTTVRVTLPVNVDVNVTRI